MRSKVSDMKEKGEGIEYTWAQAIKSLPAATIGTEYFWTGVGVL